MTSVFPYLLSSSILVRLMRPYLLTLGLLAVAAGACGGEVGTLETSPSDERPALAPPVITGHEAAPRVTAAPAAFAPVPGAAPTARKRLSPTQPFTLVVLPDTQYYAEYYPEIFDAQTSWIAANKHALDIQLVVHEGDIVNAPESHAQWQRAVRSLRELDGVVPYALARGNHDLARGVSRLGGLMDSYFPVAKYLQHSWFRETFEVGRMENNFLLVDIKGQKWVVLTLEFGPRDPVLAWANDVLSRHADMPAIVVTHAYLYGDGNRYSRSNHSHAHGAHEVALEGGSNDGEEMWEKLISKQDNILFVLSGHVPDFEAARLTSTRPSGTKVHQLLANYQGRSLGGAGYLRTLSFEPADQRVVVRTYSPYLDKYRADPANQFVLELE